MSDTRSTSRSRAPVACLVCLTVWAVWFCWHIHSAYLAHLTWIDDAATYVETARYCAEGQGLIHNCAFNRLESELTMPLRWYPPGYPLLVTSLLWTGVTAWNAALLVSAACGAAFAVMVCVLSARLLGVAAGLLVSILILSMPAWTLISTAPLSDSPFLAFATASLLALARASGSPRPRGWLFLAGLAGGAACCIRFAGMSLLGASALFIALHFLWHPIRKVIAYGLIWAAGVAATYGWLLYRNLTRFETANPYNLPPSGRGPFQNLLDTANTVLADMTGVPQLAHDAISTCIVFLGASLVVIAMTILIRRRTRFTEINNWIRTRPHWLLMSLYVIFYVSLIVISRTMYLWDPVVEPRYMVQVYWILWSLGAAGAMALCRRCNLTGWRTRAVFATLFMVLLGLQVAANVRAILTMRDAEPSILTPAATNRFARMIPSDQIVLSDAYCAMRMFSRINARIFPASDETEPGLTLKEMQTSGSDGLLWGIVIVDPDPCEEGKYGPAIQQMVRDPDNVPGFEKLADEADLLVLKWVGIPDDDKAGDATTQPSTRPTTRGLE